MRQFLSSYLSRFSSLAGPLVTCGPVLSWLEVDQLVLFVICHKSHLYKAHLLSWLEVFFIICHKSSDMSHVQSLLEVTNCFIICHIIFYFIIRHTSVTCPFLKFAISFTFIAISEVKSHKSCYMSPS